MYSKRSSNKSLTMSRLLSLLLSALSCAADHGANCAYKECLCVASDIFCNYRYLNTMPLRMMDTNMFTTSLYLDGNSIPTILVRSLPGNLTLLSLLGNPIELIEDGAFDESIATLKSVQFSGARFTQIPQAVFELKSLTDFSLSYSNILVWNEDAMRRLGANMQTFNLDVVGLTQWPDWIRSFSHLTELSISGSSISSIPDDTLDLVTNTLTGLGLYNNSLTIVPKALSNLTVLRTLSLEQNRITDPTWLPQLSNVSTLSLNNNKLSDANKLSIALRAYAGSLFSFDINYNYLTSIPELSYLKLVKSLDYTNNHISDPNSGSVPDDLAELSLGNNYLPYIPRVVKNLPQAQRMELSSNRVTSIQGSDFSLFATDVDLSDNYLTALTQTSFPSNSSIISVMLNNNPISAISIDAFVNLNGLTQLYMKRSKLTRVPLAILSLPHLMVIDMSSTPSLVCTCMEKSLEDKIKLMMQDDVDGECGHTSISIFFTQLSQDCPPLTRALQFQT